MAMPQVTSRQALVLLDWTLADIERTWVLTRFKPVEEIRAKMAIVPLGTLAALLVPYWPPFGDWRAKLYLNLITPTRLIAVPWRAPGYVEDIERLATADAPAALVYLNHVPQIAPVLLRQGDYVTAQPLPSHPSLG